MRPRTPPTLAALATLALLSWSATPLSAQDGLFDDMAARSIGPGGMSGRVAAVDVVLADRNIVYVGAATGGVFKSMDGGLTWDPVFDEEPTTGIGAVSVFQANPDIVWVGTGEGNPRNSAGVGRGLYKSIDGGRTWELMGLERSERIHRVVTHPTDPDVVWVAAMGPAWSDGQERGVYRTTDGGETWERVLWQNERTGAADLIIDPTNPDKLFAAMWEFRRDPWFFTSGGPGSGLFVTHDGGDSWSELTEEDGLPPGELGRIGLAISPSSPEVVYALVEAERSELLRSDDGGVTWRTISDRRGVAPRPFYYADLRIDPKNENRIYSLHGAIQVSEDQGRTWNTVVPSRIIHGDVHELWIDPDDPRRMIIGEDGGIAFTYDRGDHWRFVENLVLAQFYRINVDMETPYNIYGGMQDNGSWYGPMTVWENKGILNAHWRRVGGGDGFTVMNDPSSERHGYSMSQQGNIQRFDKVTGLRWGIQPVHPEGEDLRFNWNAGLTLDPHDSTTIYLGSQYVHRSSDHGRSWDIISPDLTTDDPEKQRQDVSGGLTIDATGAENHTTIVDIGVSPLEEGVIWVGTDDGNVQLTRDGGGTWTNLVDNIDGVPDATWVPDVDPSVHDAATAYVVFEDHRRGNWTPYIYRTTDYGESWERLGEEIDGFVHAVAEDPEEPSLLFAGTEFGLWFSTNGGNDWQQWTSGVPSVPIRDLIVHPRDGDLVLGTHGRGALVIDDIRPLRALAAGAVAEDGGPFLVEPPPALVVDIAEAIGYRSTGHAMQQGEMRPYGAMLSFWHAGEGSGRLEISDASGAVAYTADLDVHAGVNRVTWNLRPGGDFDESAFVQAVEVLPDTYTVSVTVDGAETTAELEVRQDPRRPVALADLRARNALIAEALALGETVGDAQERVQQAQEAVETVLGTLPDDAGDLRGQGTELRDALRETMERLFTGPECQGICGRDTPAGSVRFLGFGLSGMPGAPSPTHELLVAQARDSAEMIVDEVNALFADHVEPYRQALRDAGYTPFPDVGPLRLPGGRDDR